MQLEMNLSLPDPAALLVCMKGACSTAEALEAFDPILAKVDAAPSVRTIAFDTQDLQTWDSGLLAMLLRLKNTAEERGISLDPSGLPAGLRQLLALASAVPEKQVAPHVEPEDSFLAKVGRETIRFCASVTDLLTFIGEVIVSFLNLIRGSARYRFRDLALSLQDCGAQALPVVTLISLLIGLILAFVGTVQLRMFGAEIYVADLVAIGMAREMGALMPGIIMSGRTGAAFAAELGTMQVNDEIDSLRTMGIPPMDFLVLPRTLALVIMMPFLYIYSSFLGIMGGATISILMFGITAAQYYNETIGSVTLTDFSIGIVKSAIFGALIAVSGCLRGMQCGRSSAAVGDAATSAVVTSIVSIVVADSIAAVITSVLGF